MSIPSYGARLLALGTLTVGIWGGGIACSPAANEPAAASGGRGATGGSTATGTGGGTNPGTGGAPAATGGTPATGTGGTASGGAAAGTGGTTTGTGGSQVSSTGGGAGTGAAAGMAGSGTGGVVTGSGGQAGSATGGRGGAGATAGSTGTSTGGQAGGAAGPVTHNEFILHDDDGRLLYVNNSTPARNWAVNSGNGRDLQLVGSGRVMLGKGDGWDEYRLSDGMLMAGRHGFAGTQTAHRLADGNTVLASVSGTNIVLRFVNAAGQMQRMITYAGFDYVRCVRPTITGTYMVAAGTVIFEGNDQGNVLWQAPVPAARNLFKVMKMPNGNALAASGYGATLVVFNPAHMVIQTIGGKMQPSAAQIGPWFYADYHVMPNGNYFVVNSMADTTNNNSVQLLEYNPSGMLVWQQKQPAGVRSLEAAIVLDGLDTTKLHVEPEGRLIPVP